MAITLRQESATGASTKGSALTYAELDNNFIDLLNASRVTVRADSGTDETLGNANLNEILSVVGGTNVTTAITSDSAGEITLTINSTASGGVVDINGTGAITVDETSAGGVTISTSALSNVVEDTTPQLGGSLDGQGNVIQDVQLENYKETVYQISTDSAGSINVDVFNGNLQEITLNENVTFTGFDNPENGQSVTLILHQDGTGNRTFTESLDSAGRMLFAGGTSTLSTAGNATDIMTILYVDGIYYASLSTNFS